MLTHTQGGGKLALSMVHSHAFVSRDELGDLPDEVLSKIRLDALEFNAVPPIV